MNCSPQPVTAPIHSTDAGAFSTALRAASGFAPGEFGRLNQS